MNIEESKHEEVIPGKSIFQKKHRPFLKKLQKTKKAIVAESTKNTSCAG